MTWLYSIARNEAINRTSRRPRDLAAARHGDEEILANVPATEAGPYELAERGGRKQQIDRFLKETLDETERTVFTLHYGDEMPLDAITRLLRLPNRSGAKAFIVSAKRKISRAVERRRRRRGRHER